MGADRAYRLTDGYLLDWHLFQRLRTRGEARGTAGVTDLHAALELVRGVPLDGVDRPYAAGTRDPYTWLIESSIYPGHMVSAVVDVAHELAAIYLDAGESAQARWAVQQAWLADPDRVDDEPWRDIMHAAHLDGHHSHLYVATHRPTEPPRHRRRVKPVAVTTFAGPKRRLVIGDRQR